MASGVLKTLNSAELKMLPPWEMRRERDRATHLFVRCQVELAARDEWSEGDARSTAGRKSIKAKIDASPDQGDFLVGASTVSELDLPNLWSSAIRSYRRQQMLRLLVEVSGGVLPPLALHSFLMEHIPAVSLAGAEDAVSAVACSPESLGL